MADFYHKRKRIKFIGAIETQTDRFTIYPSPYMVFTNGGRYTKHIYIGSERIVSKVAIDNGYNPATTPTAAYGNNTYVTRLNNKSVALNDSVEAIYTKFQLPYNGLNNDNIIPGFQPSLMSLASTASSTDNYEEYSYYIHSDHLGSTSYITDSDGEVSQHVEYVPFGEVFIEELSSSAKLNTPFLFNGKELDEETGLYYYGARYYDPRTSLWLSTDPMELKYPNISTYTYCANNPIKHIDYNGMDYNINVFDDNITISAFILTTKEDYDEVLSSAQIINQQSGKWKYNFNIENDNKKEMVSLIINFEISVIVVEDNENIPKTGSLNIALSRYSKNSTGVNVMEIVNDKVLGELKNGNAIGGNFIQVKESRKGTETGAHELGHILGMGHTNSGLMTAESSNPKRSQTFSKKSIQEMLMPLKNKQVEHAGKGFIYNKPQYNLNKGSVTPINNK